MKRISVRRTVLSVLALFAFAATLIVSSQTSSTASSHSQIMAADDPKGGTGR
jgi:hypothetical protein